MKPKELLEQWSGKEQKLQIFELNLFLGCATFFFWYFNTNMLMFGVFVYIGLGWLIFKTPNRMLSFLSGIFGGAIGFLTEAWGCPNHLWNWTEPIITLWMIFGHYKGFPVEIVIAYFAAGFWIGKVSLILFEPQHAETLEFFVNKGYLEQKNLKLGLILLLYSISIIIILMEPIYIQSLILISTGLTLFLWLPKQTKKLVWPMAIFMGFVGFFFENFATGIIPSFSVWEYNLDVHNNLVIPNPIVGVAPISALIAYTGTGFILFSLTFILNAKLNS